MKTKLAAFTVIELMAVMLLSALIFSMFLMVVQIMQQQSKHQESEHQQVLEMLQLRALLIKDAYQAKGMLTEGKNVFFEYNAHGINYQFNKEKIYRKIIETQIHTDTFHIPSLDLKSYWGKQEIRNGLADQLIIQSLFFKQNFQINIQKQYDSKTLLDLEPNVYQTSF